MHETAGINTEVFSEYDKTLTIPGTKPNPQCILCPVGIIGAGKTTVMKVLAERLSLVRISSDELRKIFKEKGLDYAQVFDTAAALVEKYVRAGFSIAVDGDCASPHTRELISRAENEMKIKAIWIRVTAPERVIIERLKDTTKGWLWSDHDKAVKNYFERKPLHEDLDMPFVYTFDTSRDDIDRQLQEAVIVIKKELGMLQ